MTRSPFRESALSEPSTRLRDLIGGVAAREVILAAAGVKVARIALTDLELGKVASILVGLGLEATRSPRKYVSRPDRGKGGFSNRFASRHPQGHPEARWLLYIARSREEAESARRGEEGGSSDLFGDLLGYPPCCVAWYAISWPLAEQRHQGDLFPLAHQATPVGVAGHALLNFGANYFGGGWTSFFPCSLTCTAAIAYLRREREEVCRRAPSLVDQADEESALPLVYAEYRGVAQLRGTEVDKRAHVLRYDPGRLTITLPAPRGSLWRSMLNGDTLRPIGVFGLDVLRGARVLHRERRGDAFLRWFSRS